MQSFCDRVRVSATKGSRCEEKTYPEGFGGDYHLGNEVVGKKSVEMV